MVMRACVRGVVGRDLRASEGGGCCFCLCLPFFAARCPKLQQQRQATVGRALCRQMNCR